MKAIVSLLILISGCAGPAFAARTFGDNAVYIGDSASSNKTLGFKNAAGTTLPAIRWNSTTSRLELTEDGTNFSFLKSPDGPASADNYYCVASTATNAMTIALKTKAGNDPSASDPVKFAFRSATANSGAYDTLTVSSSLSITIPSGASLGGTDSNKKVWVYIFNDAGTARLGVSSILFNPDNNLSSTTISGSATDVATIYSGSGVTTKASRVICKVTAAVSSGNWTSVAKVVTNPTLHDPIYVSYNSTAGGTVGDNAVTFIDWGTVETATHVGLVTRPAAANTTTSANAWKFTAPRDTVCNAQMSIQGALGAVTQTFTIVGYACINSNCYENVKLNPAGSSQGGQNFSVYAQKDLYLSKGDTIKFAMYQDSSSNTTYTQTSTGVQNWVNIRCADLDDVR